MPGLHTGRQGVEVMPELDPTDQGIDKTCEPEEQRPQCQGSNREQRVDTRIPEDIDADCRERLSPIPDTPTSPVPLFTQIAEESTTVARSQPFEEPRCDTWWLPRHYGHPLVLFGFGSHHRPLLGMRGIGWIFERRPREAPGDQYAQDIDDKQRQRRQREGDQVMRRG